MSEIAKSDLFFFVSTIGFSIVATLIIIALAYMIKAIRDFNSLISKLENEIDNLSDSAQIIVDDIRHSFLYKMFIKPKHKTLLTKIKKSNGQ